MCKNELGSNDVNFVLHTLGRLFVYTFAQIEGSLSCGYLVHDDAKRIDIALLGALWSTLIFHSQKFWGCPQKF